MHFLKHQMEKIIIILSLVKKSFGQFLSKQRFSRNLIIEQPTFIRITQKSKHILLLIACLYLILDIDLYHTFVSIKTNP